MLWNHFHCLINYFHRFNSSFGFQQPDPWCGPQGLHHSSTTFNHRPWNSSRRLMRVTGKTGNDQSSSGKTFRWKRKQQQVDEVKFFFLIWSFKSTSILETEINHIFPFHRLAVYHISGVFRILAKSGQSRTPLLLSATRKLYPADNQFLLFLFRMSLSDRQQEKKITGSNYPGIFCFSDMVFPHHFLLLLWHQDHRAQYSRKFSIFC